MDQDQQPQLKMPTEIMTAGYQSLLDQKAHSELMKDIINASIDIVEQLKNKLQGKDLIIKYDAKTGTHYPEWVKVTEPSINQRGINDITGILIMLLGGNTSLSYIEADDAEKIAIDFGHKLNDLVYVRSKRYGIKKSYATIFVQTTFQTVKMHLSKAVDGRMLKFLKGTTEYKEVYAEGKRESAWQKYNPLK